MQTVYDTKTGKPIQLDPVDAKDYVAAGFATWSNPSDASYADQEKAAIEADTNAAVEAAQNMTVAQLKDALNAAEIGFKPFDAKPALLELYVKFLKGE
ncbi:MAG: hypothetical protein PHG89_10805 [Gallionella sp.]|nr:hypothetical protein [Gallionella sp.]